MELINYLNKYFYTKQQLLDSVKINKNTLADYQSKGIMPACSYRLKLNCQCSSFFGEHQQQTEIEYYAKGYSAWLGMLAVIKDPLEVFTLFSQRYEQKLDLLKNQGFCSQDAKVNENLGQHFKTEWKHFLEGTYGLCTRSGLPEDIAAKEVAILIINEISSAEHLTFEKKDKLTQAVNLLDKVSALFAPHERLNSSRHRLIDEMRRKYQLSY